MRLTILRSGGHRHRLWGGRVWMGCGRSHATEFMAICGGGGQQSVAYMRRITR